MKSYLHGLTVSSILGNNFEVVKLMKMINKETRFLISILLDPNECQTDEYCQAKYGSICFGWWGCAEVCEEWDSQSLGYCTVDLFLCLLCGKASGELPALLYGCGQCFAAAAATMFLSCTYGCKKYVKICECYDTNYPV